MTTVASISAQTSFPFPPNNNSPQAVGGKNFRVVVFNARDYDEQYITTAWEKRCLSQGLDSGMLAFKFMPERLTTETVRHAEGAFAVSCFINCDLSKPVLEKLKEMGVYGVALRCAGFDRCDIPEAEKLRVAIARVPAYSPNAIAEYAWSLILYVARKVGRSQFRTLEFNFKLESFLVGFELCGRTLGIIGTGKIGSLLASYAKAFGMKVLCFDTYRNPNLEAMAPTVRYLDSYEDVLKEADIVSLHVPLMPSTKYMINRTTLRLLKPTSILVNTSRGGLVDTEAVVNALKNNEIAGVGLDVVDGEDEFAFEDKSGTNIQNDALARLVTYRNSIVTAHQAFFTDVALGNIGDSTIDNLLGLWSLAHETNPTYILPELNRVAK